MFDLVFGHTSFLGHTGYNNHAREFFTRLNKLVKVRIRNFTHTSDISYLTQEQKNMLLEQAWNYEPFRIGYPFDINQYKNVVNIVLNETHHHFFYDNYDRPYVFYNVWESTHQPEEFFKRILDADQFWVPSNWQRQCTIEQGYEKDRVKVVPEGVDSNIFNPNPVPNPFDPGIFTFLLAGRWDYRKSTKEIIQAFCNEFMKGEPVQLVCLVDNPFPSDGMESTEERLEKYGFDDSRIIVKHFLPFNDYLAYLKNCNAFVSCARSEGWNLPLIEAIACGVPTICSNYGAQLDFAREISSMVNIKGHKPPKEVYFHDIDKLQNGTWAEPDFEHLQSVMRDVYNNHNELKKQAIFSSVITAERFSWENAAAIAFKHLEELDGYKKPKGIKLNIGSGNIKYPDYINIDKYNDNADESFDGDKLVYEDNSVEEILSEHMLEHISHRKVLDYLGEWHRVLKPYGVLKLNIPDFEWCVREWLNSDDKIGFPLHRLFGLQDVEGEIHLNGFTEETITKYLNDSGFKISKIKKEWSNRYQQQCILIEAIKTSNDMVMSESQVDSCKDIFIIGCYADTDNKKELLIKKINSIKEHKTPVAIVTHYPLPFSIQKMVDYYIYEKENILSGDWKLNYWFLIPEKLKILSKCNNGNYQSVAIISSLKNAMNLLVDKYNFAHYIESDTDIDIKTYLDKSRFRRSEGFKFTGFMYDEFKAISENGEIAKSKDIGVITNIFSFDIRWFNNMLPRIKSWQEYEEYGRGIPDLIFEKWIYDLIIKERISKDCYMFTNEFRDKVIINRNTIDQGATESKHRALLSETKDGELILFITNEADEEISYIIKEVDPGEEEISGTVSGHDAEWLTMPKKKSSFKVIVNDEILEAFNTCIKETYDETTFKFYDDTYECIKWEEDKSDINEESEINKEPEINIHFIENPTVTISNVNADFQVQFIDKDENKLIHQDDINVKDGISVWVKCARKWFTNWNIKIFSNDKLTHNYMINLTDRNIMIHFGSKSLGDTIAWFPYVEEFRKKHNCILYVSTFWNKLFDEKYPELNFINPGTVVDDLYASYQIGCEDGDDEVRNPNNWKGQPLQKTCSDILGLDYYELKPKISELWGEREIKEKYVCISEQSTMACKFWHYPHAWQSLVDWFNDHGYKVAVVSFEKTELKNVINMTQRKIEDTINAIKHAEMCLTVSSGLAWLSWALGTKSLIISGATKPFCEFTTDVIRIHNNEVCNGCLNDPDIKFNKGDWNWCERGNDFICTRSIDPVYVAGQISNHLGGLNGKIKQEQKGKGWTKVSKG
jgi:autotransporter strand-loop-strand O-heptosyltransferase